MVVFCGIHLRAFSQMLINFIHTLCLKITLLKLLSHLPMANELREKIICEMDFQAAIECMVAWHHCLDPCLEATHYMFIGRYVSSFMLLPPLCCPSEECFILYHAHFMEIFSIIGFQTVSQHERSGAFKRKLLQTFL